MPPPHPHHGHHGHGHHGGGWGGSPVMFNQWNPYGYPYAIDQVYVTDNSKCKIYSDRHNAFLQMANSTNDLNKKQKYIDAADAAYKKYQVCVNGNINMMSGLGGLGGLAGLGDIFKTSSPKARHCDARYDRLMRIARSTSNLTLKRKYIALAEKALTRCVQDRRNEMRGLSGGLSGLACCGAEALSGCCDGSALAGLAAAASTALPDKFNSMTIEQLTSEIKRFQNLAKTRSGDNASAAAARAKQLQALLATKQAQQTQTQITSDGTIIGPSETPIGNISQLPRAIQDQIQEIAPAGKNYLPWIVGGAALLAVFYFIKK